MPSIKFRYYCAVCGALATKDPVLPHEAGKPADATLGTWRCTGDCQGKVKVKREKA